MTQEELVKVLNDQLELVFGGRVGFLLAVKVPIEYDENELIYLSNVDGLEFMKLSSAIHMNKSFEPGERFKIDDEGHEIE